MTFDIDQLNRSTIVGDQGEKIGSVGQIYVDDRSGTPTFVTIKTGLFGTKETFVPLHKAEQTSDGIRVPYSKDFVKDAPNIEAEGNLTEDEQRNLFEYYGLSSSGEQQHDPDAADLNQNARGSDGAGVGTGAAAGAAAGAGAAGAAAGAAGRGQHDPRGQAAGQGVAGQGHAAQGQAGGQRQQAADNENDLVLREEQLNVSKERVQTGTIRLRKHVVTEQKTITVPVEREEFEVVREPISGGKTGGSLGEDVAEVTLSEERPVVEKEVVDKERVGLQTNTVRDERRIQAEVGHEEVDVEQDAARGGKHQGH
ncbi:PRC and DUF2382 domain-containing protein [Tsukamurella sp. 8F]|uniref:PRC and DUF2382 domain-containing protein n=1 Tax=unclassified Tsukamurella TaxID=2633480 RepID=UPI0023B8DB78|nr:MULTISPECIES: PRC and DUF2382 domain-containing protein [unclassified Tsukamurella]MDF0531657.1 PRC and DUF2382 domain-containing protein [Tsukamurella sp. 8J]MDF0588775.1 PRC and DUF2382 domain-containing protein [Tsukamurella sp. 8F]